MWYIFAALSVFGHLAVCIWIINRLHATALPHWFLKVLDKVWYSFLFGLPLAVVSWILFRPSIANLSWEHIGHYCLTYGSFCTSAAVFTGIVWARYLSGLTTTNRLINNHTEVIDIHQKLRTRPTGSVFATCLSKLPKNEVFKLGIHRKSIHLPDLPVELDGVTITHISDLHFTGQLTAPFFDEVVEQANLLASDFTAITGDIIDKPKCMPWLSDVLGKLESKHATFFILGNHDLRVKDEAGVRRAMTNNGHFDLGGRSKIVHINGFPIFFGGNEIPWFIRATDIRECPAEIDGKRPFRILLSHSPDQIGWAKRHSYELMLAGHTHGGQIRFPWIGPVFAPSRYGVKYASGMFFEEPTMLHVSRGLSGTRMLRYNCSPELTQIMLRH